MKVDLKYTAEEGPVTYRVDLDQNALEQVIAVLDAYDTIDTEDKGEAYGSAELMYAHFRRLMESLENNESTPVRYCQEDGCIHQFTGPHGLNHETFSNGL